MQIYNTLTKKNEIFKPIDEKQVGIVYMMGLQVYHYSTYWKLKKLHNGRCS